MCVCVCDVFVCVCTCSHTMYVCVCVCVCVRAHTQCMYVCVLGVVSAFVIVSVFFSSQYVYISSITETQRPFPVPVPEIIRQPVTTRVNVGEKIKLECQAEGQGVVYDWYKNGKDYRLGQADGRLVFNPAKMEDSGQFYCVAINDGGKVESFHVELSVGELVTPSLSILNDAQVIA